MKDYTTETDIIQIADPLFGPGDIVMYRDVECIVQHSQWEPLKRTWTYALDRVHWVNTFAPLQKAAEAIESEVKLYK